MLKNPIIPVFAGLLGFLCIWFGVESRSGDFVGNMLPELIGFCLEGIFFIGILTWLEDRKDRERKGEIKQSLAGAMGFICQVINSCLADVDQIQLKSSDNWTRQARTNGQQLKELLATLNSAQLDVQGDQIEAIQQLLATRLSTLDSLLSVSAQLSHAHLSAFNMILTEIHKIAKHPYFDAASLKSSFTNLLRLLVSFNNESF
jgi:hypothetical protein